MNTKEIKEILDQAKEPHTIAGIQTAFASKGPNANGMLNLISLLLKEQCTAFRDKTGVRALLKYDSITNTFCKVDKAVAIEAILNALLPVCKNMTRAKAESYFETWFQVCEHLDEMPSSLVLGNSVERAFNRIDLKIEYGDTDAFDFMTSRMLANSDAFEAFVWSLFEKSSQNVQYLWLYGEGDDCKSIIVRWLAWLLGGAFGASDTQNNYWMADCVGRRLVSFNDTANAKFPMRGDFKAATGGDYVCIQQKYDPAYSTKLDCKFIFTSNEEIQISGNHSDLKRCIYIPFDKNKKHEKYPDLEPALKNQARHILYKCKGTWDRLKDSQGRIQAMSDALISVVDETEIIFSSFSEENLVENECAFVAIADLQTKFENHFKHRDNYRWGNFKKFLNRKLKIVWGVKKTINGRSVRVIEGIKFKGGY